MLATSVRTICIIGLSFSTAAAGQPITITPHADARIAQSAPNAMPLRVQVSIQFLSPVAAIGGNDDRRKLMEVARRQLYEDVANECAILTEIFKADCRLASLNANTSVQDRGAGGPAINANGSASFELLPRAPLAP